MFYDSCTRNTYWESHWLNLLLVQFDKYVQVYCNLSTHHVRQILYRAILYNLGYLLLYALIYVSCSPSSLEKMKQSLRYSFISTIWVDVVEKLRRITYLYTCVIKYLFSITWHIPVKSVWLYKENKILIKVFHTCWISVLVE